MQDPVTTDEDHPVHTAQQHPKPHLFIQSSRTNPKVIQHILSTLSSTTDAGWVFQGHHLGASNGDITKRRNHSNPKVILHEKIKIKKQNHHVENLQASEVHRPRRLLMSS